MLMLKMGQQVAPGISSFCVVERGHALWRCQDRDGTGYILVNVMAKNWQKWKIEPAIMVGVLQPCVIIIDNLPHLIFPFLVRHNTIVQLYPSQSSIDVTPDQTQPALSVHTPVVVDERQQALLFALPWSLLDGVDPSM
ncbi:hypothetical protein HAX54_005484 [Datura stramonium]|uniref:Uncharacterized protein n=1 Tax=Datura stramonium TaxID=4076 RepID=A0ABS8TAA2_DATST|nr:hypothetical protein [Datura stramonium]